MDLNDTDGALYTNEPQFFAPSTALLSPIHDIMARMFLPTCSESARRASPARHPETDAPRADFMCADLSGMDISITSCRLRYGLARRITVYFLRCQVDSSDRMPVFSVRLSKESNPLAAGFNRRLQVFHWTVAFDAVAIAAEQLQIFQNPRSAARFGEDMVDFQMDNLKMFVAAVAVTFLLAV